MKIPPETIDLVRERTSFVELASDLSKLRRAGRGYTACCPFHEDSTPSFSINEEEGLFHCFGCGVKGSVFDYVMRRHNLSFPEAVRFLAKRAQVEIPNNASPSSDAEAEERRRLRQLLSQVGELYSKQLQEESSGGVAQEYLREREISAETMQTFGVGFAPNEWDFLGSAFGEKGEQTASDLLALGLRRISGKEKGERSYDVFRNRITFPITRSDGAVVAFGGRLIQPQGEAPKYLNSQETLLYQKRRTFYGLSQALPSIRKERTAYIVEGYLDVLGMYQAGIRNVLATCGTAVTREHVGLLRRFCNRVVLLFDGDDAGRRAAASCFELFLNSGIAVSAVLMPEGEDPDSLRRKLSAKDLEAFLREKQVALLQVFLEVEQSRTVAGDAAIEKGKVARRFSQLIASVGNAVEREALLNQGAELLRTSPVALEELLRRERANQSQDRSMVSAARPVTPRRADFSQSYANQVLVAVLCQPHLAGVFCELPSLRADPGSGQHIPERVTRFLQSVAELNPRGLGDGGVEELSRLLDKCHLPTDELLKEAERQLRVGGTDTMRLFSEAEGVLARAEVKSRLEELRSQESEVSSPEDRLRLVQAKLETRRALERVGAKGKQAPE